MNKYKYSNYILLLLTLLIITKVYSQVSLSNQYIKIPKNIIIMISDGCGLNHIKATNLYQYGELKKQVYESFPIQLFMSTYSAKNGAYNKEDKDLIWFTGYNSHLFWNDFEWRKKGATCSGAAATAMATGYKTYNGAIGVDIDGKSLNNITELAKSIGKAAGVITTVPFSDATPASFVAHNKSRYNYSEIVKDMLFKSKIDLIIGCGNPYYNNDAKKISTPNKFHFVGDSLIWLWLHNDDIQCMAMDSIVYIPQDCDGDSIPDKWKLIQTKEEFEMLHTGSTPKRLIGIPTVYETLQYGRSGDKDAMPFKVPLNESVPSLSSMVKAGLNILDNNPKGFFLMIEGGAVDWASHDNKIGRMIEEEIDFNSTVETIVDWIEKNSSWDETLLIVTSDHETGYLTGKDFEINKIETYFPKNQGRGKIPSYKWNSKAHTNSLVPIFAKGCGADLLIFFADECDKYFGNYINNSEIAQLIFLLWGIINK